MVVEILKRAFRRVKYFRRLEGSREQETKEEKLQKCLKPYQRYFFKAQDIIVWENPSESLLSIVIMNVIFWLIARMEWRVYGLLSTFALAVVIQNAWYQHIWPEIRVKPKQGEETATEVAPEIKSQEGRLSVQEVSKYATSFWTSVMDQFTRLRNLRETQPGIFCVIMCSTFLILAGIGRLFSGFALVYIVIIGLMTIPGIFIHLIPQEMKEHLYVYVCAVQALIKPPESSVDVEEYMPESSKENLEVFALAGDVQTDSNGSSSMDECLVGSVMPSHEDSSMDALDSLSLEHSVPILKQDGASDTDSDVDSALRFKNTHFNGSSSSSSSVEEEKIAKNLSFPDIEETATQSPAAGLAEAITKNLSKLGGNINIFSLLNAQLPTAPPLAATQGDSSDSEFEIIETDDVS